MFPVTKVYVYVHVLAWYIDHDIESVQKLSVFYVQVYVRCLYIDINIELLIWNKNFADQFAGWATKSELISELALSYIKNNHQIVISTDSVPFLSFSLPFVALALRSFVLMPAFLL